MTAKEIGDSPAYPSEEFLQGTDQVKHKYGLSLRRLAMLEITAASTVYCGVLSDYDIKKCADTVELMLEEIAKRGW
jgi:hypothetical protein